MTQTPCLHEFEKHKEEPIINSLPINICKFCGAKVDMWFGNGWNMAMAAVRARGIVAQFDEDGDCWLGNEQWESPVELVSRVGLPETGGRVLLVALEAPDGS